MSNMADKLKAGQYVNFNISNVECRFCHLFQPDTAFGGNKWHLQAILADEVAEELKALGLTVKDHTDKEGNVTKNILKPKKEVVTSKGKQQDPPIIVGPDGRTPFTEEIGNGSVLNLRLSARDWGSGRVGCYIEKVQVVKHVPRASDFEDLTQTGDDVPF